MMQVQECLFQQGECRFLEINTGSFECTAGIIGNFHAVIRVYPRHPRHPRSIRLQCQLPETIDQRNLRQFFVELFVNIFHLNVA